MWGLFPTQGVWSFSDPGDTIFLTFINLGFALSRCVFLASVWGRFAGLGVGVARGEREGGVGCVRDWLSTATSSQPCPAVWGLEADGECIHC